MISIRPYTEVDREACVGIYSAVHEAGQIPKQYFSEFGDVLDSQDMLTLVAVADGEIAGCGSVNYYSDDTFAQLSYGLIHPHMQRRGIGSALLISRIALLSSALDHACDIGISATTHSRPFFTKVVGFGEQSHDTDEYGNTFYNLYLSLSADLLKSSREYLREGDIEMSWDIEVPIILTEFQV